MPGIDAGAAMLRVAARLSGVAMTDAGLVALGHASFSLGGLIFVLLVLLSAVDAYFRGQ